MTSQVPNRRPRILFIAESVTLAHFARPIALAGQLDSNQYDIHLASDPRYLSLTAEPRPFTFHPIQSIPSRQFNESLAKGNPLYDLGTLNAYVDEDLALLEEVAPDLVVGDFRLSLAVSAPKAGIPYAAMVNAYWSPYAKVGYPVPDLPFVRFTGVGLGQRIFDWVRPAAFALHAIPLNRLRRRHGLPTLGSDLRRTYSWGDYTLYPDLPDAVPMAPLPPNHRFIGPVLWSPPIGLPSWWEKLPSDRPIVYVTLGSSGKIGVLPVVLDALADLPVSVIASTAGSVGITDAPSNVYLGDFLPGDQATERAALVICNGGSLTTYQAMSSGVPVIGLTSNMDQMLNMQIVEKFQAGISFRANSATKANIFETARRLLDDATARRAAKDSAAGIEAFAAANKVRDILTEILGRVSAQSRRDGNPGPRAHAP